MGSADIKLIERLRNENLEQFFTLVRMHLSFVVDINTDEVDCSADKPKQFRWNFHKRAKTSNSNSSQNNASNTKKIEEANSITEDGILRLYELIEFLSKPDNVTQEGIFRRTGSLSRQQELRQLLVTGSSLGLDDGKFSVHDCASVLKGFLAELPQPLLMDQYYQTYCTLASQYPPNAESSEEKLLTALQLLLLLLAPSHRNFLERLLRLLRLVADNEASNRMSPDTLATMFTPHLLCPRKLSPETFHADSIAVSPLVSFMIRRCGVVFVAPPRLATDAAAYFTLRDRRRALSPHEDLDESITDRTAANTVYTFVDRHRTKAENETNTTDTALAQLYAHIQALPDTQHKRRLVKHFNRQNGYGTPIQIQRTGKVAGSRSFGDSIKRHIFNKGLLNKTPKKGSGSTINVIEEKSNKSGRLADNSKADVSHKSVVLKNLAKKIACSESPDDDSDASDRSASSEGGSGSARKTSPKFVSEPNLSSLDPNEETPKNTRARSRLFRSRMASDDEWRSGPARPHRARKRSRRGECWRGECERGQCGRGQCERDQCGRGQCERDQCGRGQCGCGAGAAPPRLTSTPAPAPRAASVSPITQSTHTLPRDMQESMMTPRSRKPLIMTSERTDVRETNEVYESPSPKNDSDFVSSDDDGSAFGFERSTHFLCTSRNSKAPETRSDAASDVSPLRSKDERCLTSNEQINLNTTLCESDVEFKTSYDISLNKTKSLTEPFREYLISRSVLTATPVDLSILNKSDADEKMSDSLMYCLDGNVPTDITSSVSHLAVDSDTDRSLKCNVNIDLSPNRKRTVASCNSTDNKKAMTDKENINNFELRETDL